MLSNKQKQITLNYLGFFCGDIIDGIIGIRTKKAIKSFQKSFELTRDGIWGARTNSKALQVVKDIQEKIGCKLIDGIVGAETIEKTKQFQLRNNLVVDGIAGVKTRALLFNESIFDWNDFPHFTKKEFACKDGCGFDDEDLKVVEILENIRAYFGHKPLIITSGCRCIKRNDKVGGIKGSAHTFGKAADFYIKGVSTQNLLNYTTKLMHEGRIKYTYTNNKNMKGVVHINI